jgi:hypothetical protein
LGGLRGIIYDGSGWVNPALLTIFAWIWLSLEQESGIFFKVICQEAPLDPSLPVRQYVCKLLLVIHDYFRFQAQTLSSKILSMN